MTMQTFVVYSSPAGTTHHVGQVIQDKLTASGNDVTTLDLSQTENWQRVHEQINQAEEPTLLFIGSPVYGSLPVPPVMDFIHALRVGAQPCYAVPYVTWGMVTSGVALWRMAQALLAQGCTLVNGLAVPAVHSLHWLADDPVGTGRPSPEDDTQIGQMLDRLTTRLQQGTAAPLPLETFGYQPPEVIANRQDATFAELRQNMQPKTLHEDRCEQCGICVENCPVAAISNTPTLHIDETTCIVCFNCVRLCPQGAIQADMSGLLENLPKWVASSTEAPVTRILS